LGSFKFVKEVVNGLSMEEEAMLSTMKVMGWKICDPPFAKEF